MQGEGKAHLELRKDGRYTFGEYWPAREIIDEFCRGIGATEEIAEPFYRSPLPSVTNQELGVAAVIGASHMQFIIPRQVARQAVPLQASMGLRRAETMSLDYKIDELGCLHLSTQQPYVFHMGNTLSERLLQEVGQVTGAVVERQVKIKRPAKRRSGWQRLAVSLVQHPRLNRYFSRLYHFLFQALHAEK
jgi:hypothetical protein